MPPRRVHTVHLTAPSDTSLRRGAILLEDALHTASLPDADSSRLWLVRSLNLGSINAQHSAATLALTIEQQFRHLRLSGVHGSDPTAATATIVYFHDLTDAYCEFALRLMQPAPPTEWFWPSVLPEWNPMMMSSAIALKLTLFRLLQTPAKVMAVVDCLHRLQQANRLDTFLQILEPGDGEALLKACGWSASNFSAQLAVPLALPQRALNPWLREWGKQDARSLWLAAMELLIDQPHRVFDAQLIQHAQAWIHSIQVNDLERSAISPNVELSASSEEDAITLNIEVGISSENSSISPIINEIEARNNINSNPIEHAETSASTSLMEGKSAIDTSLSPNLTPQLYYSPYAGFFGIIPLLNQLGFSQRCYHLEFPAHLVRFLALDIPTLDPIQQLLTDQTFDALFPSIAPLNTVTPEMIAWRAAMRNWCRRYVDISLAELIERPGSFTLTRTHLDVFFNHDQADIRIRRAGLDIDPGWVPWFGRVVLFHYSNGE